MNILVIGGAGFIGSYLCRKLTKGNHYIVALDNLMRGKKENIEDLQKLKNFCFYKKDANDVESLVRIIKKHDINYIFHLAANSDIQASANDPQIEFDCTAKTTWSVLTAMRNTGVKKMFFASTSAVYGQLKNDFFVETDELNPVSYYGSAKMASEAFIKSFSFMNDFDCLIFRFPNVIGPRLTHGVIFDFIHRLKNDNKTLTVLGDGTQSKPYLHVSDLVGCIISLFENNKGVNIFNVGVETSTSVKTIAEMVVSEMKLQNCQIIYGTENVGWKGDVPKFSYCLDKIHSTGWRATMTSDEASLATIKEALENDYQ